MTLLMKHHPSLKGGVPDTPPPPVFCAIDVIIGRSRVFIFSMSRVFIFSLCCVQFLVCVMFSVFACVVCSFSTTTRPTADGGRFAPAGLALRAPPIAHCALPQVPPPVHYEGGGDNACKGTEFQTLVRCCPNRSEDFKDQPKILNASSELISNIFGQNGLHARVAVSVNALPLGAAVEIDAIFEVII